MLSMIFSTSDFIKRTNIHKHTVLSLLRQLRDNNILHIVREGKGRQPDIYSFEKLLEIADRRGKF